MFKKKDPTEQELVEEMQKVGISTKGGNGRQEKFGAFKQYAQERQNMKPGFSPVNPYANMNNAQGNPYTQGNDSQGGGSGVESYGAGRNPYGGNPGNPYGTDHSNPNGSLGNPYGSARQKNPYGQGSQERNGSDGSQSGSGIQKSGHGASNPYASSSSRGGKSSDSTGSSPYNRPQNAAGNPLPYSNKGANARDQNGTSQGLAANPYARKSRTRDDELILDLNAIPSHQPPVQIKKPIQRPRMNDAETLDLNDLEEDDLNVEVDDFLPEQEQVNSEDEEIEAIKQDIRFTKQESLALTRNTLRMAEEADASGTNTLGMLGSQSERLYNAEQNLLLADTQTKIADDKVSELRRLNRSIFIPATGNPFNKKLRLRQQEMKFKTQKEQEKYLRETNRQGMYASEQRVKQGITNNATNSDVFNKYQGEKYLQQALRYQFENDSEDDEMEKELASNLDQIHNYSKKLKSTALAMNQEVDAQNERLRKIEEDADRLDISVHLNSTRLSNIR